LIETNTGFQSDLWFYCTRNKICHLIDVLRNYTELGDIKYFIFSDCDVHYIKKNQHEWSNLDEYLSNTDKDVYFVVEESYESPLNTGFFIMKNNESIPKLIDFFVEVLDTIDVTDKKDMGLGDQTIINNLRYKINWGHIPDEYVIRGHCPFNADKCLLHHATGAGNVRDKLLQINHLLSTLESLSA